MTMQLFSLTFQYLKNDLAVKNNPKTSLKE